MGVIAYALRVEKKKVNLGREDIEKFEELVANSNGEFVATAFVEEFGDSIYYIAFKSREIAEAVLGQHGLAELVEHLNEENELWVNFCL